MTCGKTMIVALIPILLTAIASAQSHPFPKGTWSLELTPAYITPIRFSDDRFYILTLAGSYYLVDNLSIGGELHSSYVDQPDEDAVAAGLGFLVRFHFFTRKGFSLFIDGGAGVFYSDPEVPELGTHFNYTPKGGIGLTIELDEDLHAIGGVRYFHLSNGNVHGRDQNPSYDGIQFYAGLLWAL